MNINALFCNVDYLTPGRYVALPVVVWDVVVERAEIPLNYFSELIVKILTIGDKSIEEMHQLTNLDENLIRYILERDLANVVTESIDKWHLCKSSASRKKEEVEKERVRITVLQSMVTGRLIPHPVYRNALRTIEFEKEGNECLKIVGGSKGKPVIIKPFLIHPQNENTVDILAEDVESMWEEYEYNDSEIAMSDYEGVKSEYIDHPEKILTPARRMTEENAIDCLLVKVESLVENEMFVCNDLLEPSLRIPMDFLTSELKECAEENENIAAYLDLKKVEIPLSVKDSLKTKYPRLSDRVIEEACRLLVLKGKMDESAMSYESMDDTLLSRTQTLYECLLRDRDIFPLPEKLEIIIEKLKFWKHKPKEYLVPELDRKNICMDKKTLRLMCVKSIWLDMEWEKASLKSLIVRHLLVYLKSMDGDDWFGSKLDRNGLLGDALTFLMKMANARNSYQHYNENRAQLPYSYKEVFDTVEKHLEVFNEVG